MDLPSLSVSHGYYFGPGIGLATKRSSFLLQIAVLLRSMLRHKQSALSLLGTFILTEMVSDVLIVFSSCIVERTCGVLTVWSQFASMT